MVKKKWIEPPGLKESLARFRTIYNYLRDDRSHILIRGSRGVGKSMFVEDAENFFRAVEPDKPFIRRNIASIPDTLIDSELFGHEKGAFTDAKKPKVGILEQAKDGLLILEEIGDISKYAQAKLLTFLEDRKYFRVGGLEERSAGEVWIIGTTNRLNDDDFRPDFLDRFFPFMVPSIKERRKDVLYYFQGLFPDVFENLTGLEIIRILSHPWDGGVREIQRVARQIMIGLSRQTPKKIVMIDYKTGEQTGEIKDWSTEETISTLIKPHAMLDFIWKTEPKLLMTEALRHPFAKGIKKKDDGIIPAIEKEAERFKKMAKDYAIAESSKEHDIESDLSGYTWEDLERKYYEDLLRATGGNQAKAARRAGLKPQTFHDRLKKSGITDSVSVKPDNRHGK